MIESVWIEIRPALRCCHVCVVLKKNILRGVQLKVRKTSVLLEINKKSFEVLFSNFTVEPLTMSNFQSSSKFLSFRVQTECSFNLQSFPQPKISPPVLGKEKVSILCQCYNPLTSEVIFNRILPLPSNQFSLSDMFCHLHGDNAPIQNNLHPKPDDCFYSDDFLVINGDILKGCNKKEKFLKCKRCLTTVGVCDSSVKFWISCIKLPYSNVTLLQHFKNLLLKVVSDPFAMFPKILLENEENQSYLSIIVIDKNLVVSNCVGNLEMKNSEVVKVKYKFHMNCDSEVKLLKEDPFHSLHHVQVHKTMMDFSVQHLVSCSKSIPTIFSRADEEFMAYLHLTD